MATGLYTSKMWLKKFFFLKKVFFSVLAVDRNDDLKIFPLFYRATENTEKTPERHMVLNLQRWQRCLQQRDEGQRLRTTL